MAAFTLSDPKPLRPQHEAQRNGYINYNLAPGEELRTCPYNEAHQILSARFARHLVKCRSNYQKDQSRKGQKVEMVVCRFNFKHHIPRMEKDYHEKHCESSASVVEFLQNYQHHGVRKQEDDDSKFDLKIAKPEQAGQKLDTKVFQSDSGVGSNASSGNDGVGMVEESWDEEVSANIKAGNLTYNPVQKLKSNYGKIIQNLSGLSTKSERKAFRQAQADMFYKNGGVFEDSIAPGDEEPLDGPAPRQNQGLTSYDLRLRRAKELALAQKNANLGEGHHEPHSRRRRSDKASEQLQSVMSLARSEQESHISLLSSEVMSVSSTDERYS